MGIFLIPPVNPIRFIQPGGRLDRLSAAELINSFQQPGCYMQKWETGDLTRLQVLSDYEFTMAIHDLVTGNEVEQLDVTEVNTFIVGQSFRVFEIDVAFEGLLDGLYYLQAVYEDEDNEEINLVSEPFEVAEMHPETLVFDYKNSENNFSVVFNTGITFRVRVEGNIELFTPETDDVIYNDQLRNATILDSIPYRSWTLFIGHAPGVASWMLDLINRVMACDEVRINGDYYTKKVGSNWDMKRADEYPFAGMTCEIVPVENRFGMRLKTSAGDGEDPGDIVIVQKVDNHTDITGSLSVAGKFRDKTLLEKIAIIRTGTPFNMRIGTTNGGDQVGEFQITDLITTITVNHLFDGPVTLWLTGLGTVSFLSLIYKQLDEKPLNPGASGPGVLGRGATIIYSFSGNAELDQNFNIETGLGIEETPWQGWAIADGRNGTIDMGGLVPVGYKFNSPFEDIGSEIGEEEFTITEENLPEHRHFGVVDGSSSAPNISNENTVTRTRTGAGQSNYNMGGSNAEPTLSPSSTYGSDDPEPISLIQPGRIVLWVTKITD